MIRVSRFEALTDEKLQEINKIYEQSELFKGEMSKQNPGHHLKNNEEMNTEDHYYKICASIVSKAIATEGSFFNYASVSNMKKFSRFIFSEYSTGMFYHSHNDSHAMGPTRSDWSCTLFLNDPTEYDGGELMINIGDREIPYKLNAGEYVLYPTGLTHRVNEVVSGKRRVCVFWAESFVFDSRIRSILCDVSMIQEKYYKKWTEEDQWLSDKFGKIFYNLRREFFNN